MADKAALGPLVSVDHLAQKDLVVLLETEDHLDNLDSGENRVQEERMASVDHLVRKANEETVVSGNYHKKLIFHLLSIYSYLPMPFEL